MEVVTQEKEGHKGPPIGWSLMDVTDFCKLQRGYDITERERVDGDVPVYSSSGLSYFHNKAKESPPGVITGRKGQLGKVFYVTVPFWPHDTTLFVKDFCGNDPHFVALILEHFHLERFNGSTSVPTLNRNSLKGHYVQIPRTKNEQQAIANALSEADALIESLEQLIEKKRQIKQGVMQELLTGKRRLPGFSGEWEVKRLGDLGVFFKGSGVTKSQTFSGKIPCVRYGEIYTRHDCVIDKFYSFISQEVAQTATKLKQGDILFAGSGETKEEIGKCVAYLHKVEAYAGGDIVILRPDNADSRFLGYFLNTTEINHQKASRGQGDAVVHISSAALSSILIKIPTPQEQVAIAEILFEIDQELKGLEAKLAKSNRIKQAMMQNLLTGKVRLV